MPTRPSETEFIRTNLSLSNRFSKRIDAKLSVHGISFSEFTIMRCLHDAPEQTMRRIDLAQAVGITASGVTRLLAPMEKIGLVLKEANPRDARVSLVRLSSAGGSLHADASKTFGYAAQELLDPLTDRQLEQLVELTGRLG
jgi:DNA-binding MarR family transcriptional regulator